MSSISNQQNKNLENTNTTKKESHLECKESDKAIDDIVQCGNTLNTLISKIIRHYNRLQLADHTKSTVSSGNNLITTGATLLRNFKNNVKTLETLLSDCSDFVEEVKEDLSFPKREGDFVYLTSGGMLSYPGRDLIVKEEKKEVKDKKPNENKKQNKNDRVLINELGYYLKLPVVTDIKQIPPALYYFKEDDNKKTNKKTKNRTGIYINLGNGNYARIPFPEIVDSKKEYDRKHSIRCKYISKKDCDDQRYKMSKYHNTQIRTCNFAHTGDQIIKIGYPSRCPSVPNYGTPETFSDDIKNINMNDAKNLLMNGLNDVMSSVIWFDYAAQKENIFSNLESA